MEHIGCDAKALCTNKIVKGLNKTDDTHGQYVGVRPVNT